METSEKNEEPLYEASAVSNFKENPAENWRLNCLCGSINHAYNSAYVIIEGLTNNGPHVYNSYQL